MTFSRRNFLRTGTAAALAAGTIGCDQSQKAKKFFPELFPPSSDDTGPFDAPDSETTDVIVHALNRMTWGTRPGDYARVKAMGATPEEAVAAFLEEQLAPEKIEDDSCYLLVRQLESLSAPPDMMFEYREEFLLEELTRGTLLRSVYSKRQLYEVMVGFWTDHFNIDPSKGDDKWLKASDDRDVIRKHALGTFPDLVRASALSPAMLWYLDGRVNRKSAPEDKPNENYARELLELHTLGVHGGYTQQDVMEVARCLTGWTVRSEEYFGKGLVEFREGDHDDGAKLVMGQPIPSGLGRGDLDRVLEIIGLHPSTARYVSTKLCRRFIADEPQAETIDAVTSAFLKSNGDIPSTLRAVFSTDEYHASRCARFKRPYHFVVSALRATGAQTDARKPVVNFLTSMGHAPFQYPTPDGYPLEPSPWMGTLLWRWKFAAALAKDEISGTRIKAKELEQNHRGERGLIAHILGRKSTDEEWLAYRRSGMGLALILSSPAFQRC